jgi:hypothetical protein
MRTSKLIAIFLTVFALTVAFTLTLSCSSDNNGGNDPSPQPLPGLPSSSDNGSNGNVSSSSITNGNGSSSSVASDGNSSSSVTGGDSSSSGSDTSSSSVSGGDGSFNPNSQVYKQSDGTLYTGNGIIKIRMNSDVSIDAGSVTNGIVNLELPTILNEYLAELFDYQRYNCNVNPNDIIGLGGDDRFGLFNSNGELISKLRIWDEQKSNAILYWYFSKAGKITCNYESSSGEARSISIDAKTAGWNKVYEGSTIKYSTDNILTNNVRWTLQAL